MKRHWQYLKYVLKHKWYVFQECLKLDVPLWIAVLHDWDKFISDEWIPYAKCFYAEDGTKQYKEDIDFSIAWMKHQHRNKHHWQYWCQYEGVPIAQRAVMIWDRGQAQRCVIKFFAGNPDAYYVFEDIPKDEISVLPMPDLWRREMLADWRGAGKAITGKSNTLEWYTLQRDKMILHPDTRAWIENQLNYQESEKTNES